MSCRMNVLSLILLLAVTAVAAADVTITIDPAVQYQTIRGWGAASGGDTRVSPLLLEQVHDVAVNDYGLTRLRIEPPGGNRSQEHRWEWDNDNADPDVLDWSRINTADWDAKIANWVVPFRQKVLANGDPFECYVSPSFFDGGSTGKAPAWLLHSPGENAEFALSLLLYLKNTHGITADYYCILNEAGNNNAWTASVVGRMIKTLGPRLQAAGLSTKIQFPECLSVDATWSYIQALQGDADIWPYVGMISYHLYGSSSHRSDIRNFAAARNLPTGQTEYMGLTTQHLYDDLTLGGCSYWEVYGYQGRGSTKISYNKDGTQINGRGNEYWPLRQVMHYVRPGAVRVGVTSSDATVRPLAFVRGGRTTVVLINNISPNVAQTVQLSGLAPGQYGISRVIGTAACTELGVQTVSAAGMLTVSLPANCVQTIYPHPGGNTAPVFTGWGSSPDYLTLPASTTTLSAGAVDPELNALSYTWTVKSKPAGATVALSTPNAASCAAAGLAVAGEYVFAVSVFDGANTVTRDVLLRVHAANEPPVLIDVHNRIPVLPVVADDMVFLRAGAYDLEGDSLTYMWTLLSKPAEANPVLETPEFANTDIYLMTVPGDYVLRLEASDATHTVHEDLVVRVYPTGSAPAISSAVASPASVPLYRDTSLAAVTSDANGDTVTHWWSVKTAPAGAKPVFAKPGGPATAVSGLTAQGTYTFTVSAIDFRYVTNRDVTVTVGPRLAGDIDRDGYVNVFDIFAIAECWNTRTGDPTFNPEADLDDDGAITVFDIFVIAENWNA